jgi:hypothetical protein
MRRWTRRCPAPAPLSEAQPHGQGVNLTGGSPLRRQVDLSIALPDALFPIIRLHDLRHIRAALLLAAGEPVKVS